jgi:hypothetical protein
MRSILPTINKSSFKTRKKNIKFIIDECTN